MKTTMHQLMAATMVMVMVMMGATAQSASCGQGLFSDASGCCPMAMAGGAFYRDARGCYPTLTSVGVLYADSNGCYPNANGTYEVQGANCTTPCQVQCLNATTPANATASPSPSATPLVGGPANVTANLTTCESLDRSPLPCDTPMQPFEMMLLALRPLQLNCNCNGTTALPNQQPPSAPSVNATSANATAAANETMAANATAAANETMAANATAAANETMAANATAAANETMAANATTFQASAQAQGQALTIEKICSATCSANLCNDTCLRVFIAENATEATNANDIQILNFALTLELLDSTFFAEGLNNFTAADFEAAGFPNTTFDFITRIRDNELGHAAALQSAIGSLGGTPVQQCNYSFPVSNVTQFVEIAQRLENVGVSAYDGTLAFLTSPQLQTTGATIASVEARHAAYLNLLRGMIPFPDALDTPLPIATVLGITDAFVVSCPDEASQQMLEILRSRGTATPANATQS